MEHCKVKSLITQI
jgi:hypothetical protein